MWRILSDMLSNVTGGKYIDIHVHFQYFIRNLKFLLFHRFLTEISSDESSPGEFSDYDIAHMHLMETTATSKDCKKHGSSDTSASTEPPLESGKKHDSSKSSASKQPVEGSSTQSDEPDVEWLKLLTRRVREMKNSNRSKWIKFNENDHDIIEMLKLDEVKSFNKLKSTNTFH